jgi:hypothetical protein
MVALVSSWPPGELTDTLVHDIYQGYLSGLKKIDEGGGS